MKEIQEKRIEKEILQLEENKYYYRTTKKISKEEYYFELSYTHPDENNTESIIFILHLCPNFPFNSPKLYCKSSVSQVLI